ncbi:MAG TPA: VWA domain-containing protein [Hyphomicrobiaceae bacterium]|jgi:Ca-activated chloride channel family protein|nr:VWA domain-containing protein [Hyphomicrobiaceae bacterium]
MQKVRRCLSVAAAALGFCFAATSALAADAAALMVVVDGSGSMAGLLEPKGRQTKINLVRDSLRAALAAASPQARVGLAAFGHRRGGCNDVEIMRAPEPIDLGPMMASLAQLKARGKGPLTFAVREAAKVLPEDAASRGLLLIHDGVDNCQQDVCAAAAELSAAGIAAHVVSLGVSAEDLGKIACLPHTTGGRHFKVETPEQVDAAIGEILQLSGSELAAIALAPRAPGAPSWAAQVVPPAPVPAGRSPVLHLKALAAPNTEPLSAPLHWMVSREGEPDTVLFDAPAANPAVAVAPGRYVVTVRGDLVSASQSVTVPENRPVTAPLVLGAGALRVRVTAQKTAAPLADAIITVSAADGAPLAVFKSSEATALLPAGRFRITAELGLVRAEQTVTITEGRQTPADIVLNVGRLQLSAGGREGLAPHEAALFVVMEDDPPRGRREVARSAASEAEFALPPGTYYVIARQGSIEARERLEIGSGDIVRRSLSAATGRLGQLTNRPGSIVLAQEGTVAPRAGRQLAMEVLGR